MLIAQFPDIYYFFMHSFGIKSIEPVKKQKTKFSYFEFKRLYKIVNHKVKELGQETVNAKEFVLELREKNLICELITEHLFGFES